MAGLYSCTQDGGAVVLEPFLLGGGGQWDQSCLSGHLSAEGDADLLRPRSTVTGWESTRTHTPTTHSCLHKGREIPVHAPEGKVPQTHVFPVSL